MVQAVRRRLVAALRRAGWAESVSRHRASLLRTSERLSGRARTAVATPRLRRLSATDSRAVVTTMSTSDGRRRTVIAVIRDDPSVVAAAERNAQMVRRCLELDDVPYRVVPITSLNRHRVSVLASDRKRVARALHRHAPATAYLYIDDHTVPHRRRVRPSAALGDSFLCRGTRIIGRSDVIRVFEFLTDSGAADVLGDLHGCEIEFWREHPPDESRKGRPADETRVVASRSNLRVTELSVKQFRDTAADELADRPTVTDVRFPVDLVYTWVDGSDPAWQERRAVALGLDLRHASHPEAASDARYTSYDELRSSLRSVERFADFVRHIFIVTDSQRPSWLVDDHPRLTVVDHREIFDPAHLPTFNSHSIESRLHHVPGLSEHYVYMNDDFLFGRRVAASTFFHGNGVAKFFPSRALIPLGTATASTKPVDMAAMNGRDLFEAEFGTVPRQKMRHAPYPQRRSVLLDIERRFPEQVAATSASRVRSATDLSIASFLHHYVAYATGRAVPDVLRNEYVDLGRPDLELALDRLRGDHSYDSLCLNDSDNGALPPEEKRRLVSEFLHSCFPEPSSFERS